MKYTRLPDQYRFDGYTGEQRRFNHEECNDTRQRLYVKRTTTGFLFHCHNCGSSFSGFSLYNSGVDTPSRTLQKYKEMKQLSIINKEAQDKVYNSVSLPYDFTCDIPYKGVMWLEKYYVTEKQALTYNIGYSKILDRLILPVYNIDREVIFWQGRNLGIVDKEHPKYKNCRIPGKSIYMDSRIINPIPDHTNTVVLVEDILSAIRVGEVIPTWSLLGSYISSDTITALNEFTRIKIWLDSDKYKTALKYAERIRQLLNKIVTVIYTTKDPKEYTNTEIRDYLI